MFHVKFQCIYKLTFVDGVSEFPIVTVKHYLEYFQYCHLPSNVATNKAFLAITPSYSTWDVNQVQEDHCR